MPGHGTCAPYRACEEKVRLRERSNDRASAGTEPGLQVAREEPEEISQIILLPRIGNVSRLSSTRSSSWRASEKASGSGATMATEALGGWNEALTFQRCPRSGSPPYRRGRAPDKGHLE